MADLPDLKPLNRVWPVRPGDQGARRKSQEPAPEHPPEPPRERRRRPDDDESSGHIDEYA